MAENPPADKAEKPNEKDKPKLSEETPVETEHRLGDLEYTVVCGRMPLRDDKDEIVAQMFYTAYRLKGSDASRPLLFSFNGGPGSPSLWLHLGVVGPKRVHMPDPELPRPPFTLVDNPETWLHFADLVFIDPVGTGYSRARTPEEAEKYWGLKADAESVSEFIRLFLTRNGRWASPLYIVGESYGTTRAAAIAGHLIDRGVAFNGLILVSSILNFQTARFVKGNDLPYILFLPTYAATAWYHRRARPRPSELRPFLRKVEEFAIGEYARALAQGDRLDERARRRIARKVAGFTGLSPDFVMRRDLRIEIQGFCKELMRPRRRTVGRLDSRFLGIDLNQTGERPEHDPSMSALMPPYTAMHNQYVRTELGYETDLEYQIFGGIKKPWDWGSAGEGHPDTSESLRKAMSKNPHMRVFVASGYFDLATPHFATEYTLSHMGLDPEVRGNVTTKEYEAGHMMYIHGPSLRDLSEDVRDFFGR